MTLISKAIWFTRYMSFFAGMDDVRAFRALRRAPKAPGPEVRLHVRRKPGAALVCRPGTTDAQVLWDVFWGRYHLPPEALGSAPVIFDLGANVGFTCFDLGTRYPGARVVGVELDEDNAAMARRNTAALGGDCRIVHAAIWREDGTVTYDTGSYEWGYRISGSGESDKRGEAEVSVRALSIDTLMREVGVDRVDYMKVDIEGAEAEILTADATWLERVDMLNIEIHPPATFETCEAILSHAGFSCTRSTRHRNAILATRTARTGH